MNSNTAEELLKFIQKSPTAYQAVQKMEKRFAKAGFQKLQENEHWEIHPGGRYYVTRNGSAIAAFSIPEKETHTFHIIASHSDSPTFKIKWNPEMETAGVYIRLNVEKYGGMLMSTWFDRPLSVAGRLVVRRDGKISAIPVTVDRDLLMIPSLAIHMNREINDGYKYNAQEDLLPLYGLSGAKGTFLKAVAVAAGVCPEEVLDYDLFLYNRMPGTIWGAQGEFLSSPRLDDLQCAFSSMEGLLKGKKQESICVHCVLDNEEVGSTTKQGAASPFLRDTLMRIFLCLGKKREEYLMALSDSFLISADNAHAVHPNYADKADPVNRPLLNGGIVLKYNANQKYCTDALSGAYFRELCREAGVPVQTFVNRSDMAGGSTLGNISTTQVPLSTADIGLPQLAMHSAYETAGVQDTQALVRAAEVFFR